MPTKTVGVMTTICGLEANVGVIFEKSNMYKEVAIQTEQA